MVRTARADGGDELMGAAAGNQVPAAIHHAAIYGSDDEFLAMAVPFVRGGIAAGEPVFAATTPANLDLLTSALGRDAAQLDQQETAVNSGPRPPQQAAALEKYARRRGGGGRVRILAGPPWAGQTAAEVSDWQRMEAGFNLLLDSTGIWMICPYDARQVPAPILRSALRTHPAMVEGTSTRPSPGYTDPARYAASLDSPLPPPPASAALLPATIRLPEIRRFAASQAAAAHLDPGSGSQMIIAVHETAAYLDNITGSPVTTRIWHQPGAVVCDLHADGRAPLGAFDGYRMPDPRQPHPDDGLWYARQFTIRLDLRATASGVQARLQLPGTDPLEST
jgi:MEDS: MEthanogen/methylotroph, DcmR Sensory domain